VKTFIAIAVFGAVGFGAMQLYQHSQKDEKTETDEAKPEKEKPAEKTPEKEKPPVAKKTSSGGKKTPKKETSKPVTVKSNDPPRKQEKPKPPAKMYFVPEEMNPNGIPSVLAIHNMPSEGKVFRLHLVGVKSLNKDKFGRKVKSGNQKEWEWDVSVEGGVITLAHKGKNIPRGPR
jgi:hypothetical protein